MTKTALENRPNRVFQQTSIFVGRRNKIVTVTPTTRFLLRWSRKHSKIKDFLEINSVTVPPSSERRARLLRGWIVTAPFLRGELVTVAFIGIARRCVQKTLDLVCATTSFSMAHQWRTETRVAQWRTAGISITGS
jgi:hypothetical protein